MTILLQHLFESPEHIPTLARWFQDQWGALNPDASYESRIADLGLRTKKTELPLTIVASENHKLLGTYSLDLEDMHTRSDLSPWLASVYVNPKFRKKGIGTLLVKDAIIRAKDLGIRKMYLFTPDQAAWYEKMGWKEMEKTVYHGTTVTIMRIATEA
jgi:GNAT superfamily N-acetyltransferase